MSNLSEIERFHILKPAMAFDAFDILDISRDAHFT